MHEEALLPDVQAAGLFMCLGGLQSYLSEPKLNNAEMPAF